MSVLDRVKNFLPQIAEANRQLEEEILATGRTAKQIDVDLVAPAVPENNSAAVGESKGGVEVRALECHESEAEAEGPEKVVNLEFALGDFDDTLIAAIEDAKEEERDEGPSADDDDDVQVLKLRK